MFSEPIYAAEKRPTRVKAARVAGLHCTLELEIAETSSKCAFTTLSFDRLKAAVPERKLLRFSFLFSSFSTAPFCALELSLAATT